MPRPCAPLLLLCAAPPALACSNFMMANDFRISARTMDLGGGTSYSWAIETRARGTPLPGTGAAAAFGYARFFDVRGAAGPDANLTEGGLNEAGLSCDMQTLLNSTYPAPSRTPADVWVGYFCDWALGSFASTAALQRALAAGAAHFWGTSRGPIANQHFIVRDGDGLSVVVEWMDGGAQVYEDRNDGQTGFGVTTNEPAFPWHVRNVQHFLWKRTLARSAVAVPGAFYPDERFLRIHLMKSAMPPPNSYRHAVMQAVHVLNSVTVPPGLQLGTDSGFGEGGGDHTNYGVVYDHKGGVLYWRSELNQNLQRLRLSDVPMGAGAARRLLLLNNSLPWFEDASPVDEAPQR